MNAIMTGLALTDARAAAAYHPTHHQLPQQQQQQTMLSNTGGGNANFGPDIRDSIYSGTSNPCVICTLTMHSILVYFILVHYGYILYVYTIDNIFTHSSRHVTSTLSMCPIDVFYRDNYLNYIPPPLPPAPKMYLCNTVTHSGYVPS